MLTKKSKMDKVTNPDGKNEDILLMFLPFWPPQIPPLGISCLKSYLQPWGYRVTTVDLNPEDQFRGEIYNRYFEILAEHIPPEKKGNLYGIGTDVLKNHLMAHINYKRESEYVLLVKDLIYKTYYTEVENSPVLELNRIVAEYYRRLEENVSQLLAKIKPSVFGLSVTSGTLPSSLFAFRLVKEKYPHIMTVMGGGVFSDHLAVGSPNFESFLEKTKDCIDHFIIGEGELLFLKLLRGEFPASKRVLMLNDIDGELVDLSTLEVPDFSDFDIRAYPYAGGYASRSCPFQCSFCSETIFWGKYRKKDVKQTVEELIKLYKRHGTQLFSLSDSLLNPVITDLANAFIRAPHAIYWDACLRAGNEVCNEENVHLWRKGGFYKAWLGLESGSQRVLDLMNKRLTLDQTRGAVVNLADAGIKTATLWLIGFPGETEGDFRQTLDLIEELKDYIYDAEGTPFWYFLKGQAKSDGWNGRRSIPLYSYPESSGDMLIARTWTLEGEPSREVAYERHNRFIRHIRKLGVPNPYTLREMVEADERWKKLHPNAVPSITDFDRGTYIDECKQVERVFQLPHQDIRQEDGDFGF